MFYSDNIRAKKELLILVCYNKYKSSQINFPDEND